MAGAFSAAAAVPAKRRKLRRVLLMAFLLTSVSFLSCVDISMSLVPRTRSSHDFAASAFANFGIGTLSARHCRQQRIGITRQLVAAPGHVLIGPDEGELARIDLVRLRMPDV